ncbi:MAG: glycosyl hydrolase, partial [Aurantibacter sp.]
MKNTSLLFLVLLCACNSCNISKEKMADEDIVSKVSDEIVKKLGITNKDSLSAASKRAIEMGYEAGPEWWTKFSQYDLKGVFEFEPGVYRRDPSAIIEVDNTYYVYYSKSDGKSY